MQKNLGRDCVPNGTGVLPEDLWLKILGCLDAREAAQTASVCKAWKLFSEKCLNASLIMHCHWPYEVRLDVSAQRHL